MGKYTDAYNNLIGNKRPSKPTSFRPLVPEARETSLDRRFESLGLKPSIEPRVSRPITPVVKPQVTTRPIAPNLEEQRIQRQSTQNTLENIGRPSAQAPVKTFQRPKAIEPQVTDLEMQRLIQNIRQTGREVPEIEASGRSIFKTNLEERIGQLPKTGIVGNLRETLPGQIEPLIGQVGPRQSAFERGAAGTTILGGTQRGLGEDLRDISIAEGKAEGVKGLGAIEFGGALAGTAIQYLTVGKALKGIPAIANLSNSGRFAATQGVDLLVDNFVQAPKEFIDAINNDRSLGEDAIDFGKRNLVDIAFNLAVGGASEAFKKLFKSNDPTVRQAAQEVLDSAPDATKKTIQQELGLEEGVTAQSFLKDQEQVAKEIEAEQVFKQFETDPIKDFTDWRSKNFGGATGQVAAGDMTALKQLYKEDTGIDLDVAIKEFRDLTPQIPQAPKPLTPQVKPLEIPKPKTVAEEFRAEQGLGASPFKPEPLKVEPARIETPSLELPSTRVEVPQAEIPTTKPRNLEEVITRSPQLKDVGTTERWTTDVFRNFEKVFGDNIDVVKKEMLDPFDNAKKLRVEDEIRLTDTLKSDVVDNLGIKKGSKESALVQQFGEKRITEQELINKVGQVKANQIIQADAWFRKEYDELIDAINVNRESIGKEPIGKLDNYYRHFTEMGDTFQGIKNIFESNRQITPGLEGVSEFTRPGEKWAGFKQRRTGGGAFKDDAVGGFLDYVKAGTYAKHIDPQIPGFRKLHRDLSAATEGSKNINNFIGFLDEYANDLSGKTNKFDRAFQDLIGRKPMAILNTLNSRVKSNAVLGNLSSSLSQIANVPQGVAFVKNPKQLAGGLDGYFKSLVGKGDSALYEQSGFLKERLSDSFSKFDNKLLDQPKKLAGWMLGALDEVGTKYIWSSTYRKAISEGIENPVKYADDITRKMVAGRGIGEVPIIQKSKLFQLVAPFTLEVNNLWKVQKDFLKNKDMGGLMMLYVANNLLNDTMESVRGSGVVFDPIQAVQDGYAQGEGLGDKLVKTGGALAGEIISNVPLGQFAAQVVPEFGSNIGGVDLPGRAELFGKQDPTRFGVGLPIQKAIQDPVKNLLLPFGGGQLKKTITGGQALGLIPEVKPVEGKLLPELKLRETPSSISKSGRLRTIIEPTIPKTAQSLAFGQFAVPEVREFFDRDTVPYGEKQTENINKLIDKGFDPKKLDNALTKTRTDKLTKKDERINSLIKSGFSKAEANNIAKTMWGYK